MMKDGVKWDKRWVLGLVLGLLLKAADLADRAPLALHRALQHNGGDALRHTSLDAPHAAGAAMFSALRGLFWASSGLVWSSSEAVSAAWELGNGRASGAESLGRPKDGGRGSGAVPHRARALGE